MLFDRNSVRVTKRPFDRLGWSILARQRRDSAMSLITLLLCSLFVFGQSTVPSPEPKAQSPAGSADQDHNFGLGTGAEGRQLGTLDILSDTHGVDFGPYLRRILEVVRQNWYELIPQRAETMKGKVAIEFAITKDGKIADERLVATSGDAALDRAAWSGIYSSSPFPALPTEFTGPYLALRFRFFYNPDKCDLDPSLKTCNDDFARSGTKSKSGIAVSITVPVLGDTEVPLGGLKFVRAAVTGTGSKENSVEWSVSGFGCSGNSCGEMSKGAYHAPTVMPSSPFVTLTAVSTADPSAKASVTLHIVGSEGHH
jgi:TonB family protein